MHFRSFARLFTTWLLVCAAGSFAHADDNSQPWPASLLPARAAALVAATDALEKTTSALCERTNQERLDLARAAWRDAMVAWRAYEPLAVNPGARAAIDSGVANAPRIEAAVRQYTEDPTQSNTGPADFGLPAIEYLFWGDARAKAQLGRLAFKQRCAYTHYLTTDVARAASALTDSTAAKASGVPVSAYLDNLLALLDTINATRLGSATAPSYSDAAVAVDAWRSEQGKAALGATLDTLGSMLLSNDGNPNPLSQQAGTTWAATGPQNLKASLEQIRSLLAAQPGDLADAFRRNSKTARQLREAMVSLRGQVATLRQAIADQGKQGK
ncbi:MAG: hypothetical protein JO142_08130 [Burkholderiales bacterium]|nr:hypothetical protein [Burkholderiales bacterium]